MSKIGEKGFSIVQALVVSGALAGMALVGTKLNLNQKMAAKDASSRDNVEQIHSMIYSILQNRLHCFRTVTGANGGHATVSPNELRNIGQIRMDGQATHAFELTTSSTSAADATSRTYLGVRIVGMALALPNDLSTPARLTIDYLRDDGVKSNDQKQKTAFGSKNIRKVILLALERTDATTINGCTAVATDSPTDNIFEQTCNDFEYTYWDSDLKTCLVRNKLCPVSSDVFVGIRANGEPICEPLTSFLSSLVDSGNPPYSCPAHFDSIHMTREGTTNGRVRLECNKVGETCPSDFNRTWYGPNGERCETNLPRGDVGQIILNRPDAYKSTTEEGFADFRCDPSGAWVMSNPRCTAKCPATPGSTKRAWNVNGRDCHTPLPEVDHGFSQTFSDNDHPGTGSIVFSCVQGVWTEGTKSCNISCPDTTKTWTVDGDTCSVNLTTRTDNQWSNPDPAVDNTGNIRGRARFQCAGGTWAQRSWNSSPLNSTSCEYVGATPGGLCSWTGSTSWEYNDCSGFQIQDNPAGSQVVARKNDCYALCTGCVGGKTFKDCIYTPNP